MAQNPDKNGKKITCICVDVPNRPSTSGQTAGPTAGPSTGQPPKRKSCKPGILTKNAFLNYCRYIRETNCGLSATQVVKRAAQEWRLMSAEKKKEFTSNCGGGRKTRNPFLNYVREVRGSLCGTNQANIVKQAAQQWRLLSNEEKMKYKEVAKKTPRRHGLKNQRKQQRLHKN